MLTGHKAEGECADGVIYHRVNGIEKEHQTQKPVEVMADLMRVRPEWETVLDPFCGTGTTLLAAMRLGRQGEAVGPIRAPGTPAGAGGSTAFLRWVCGQ